MDYDNMSEEEDDTYIEDLEEQKANEGEPEPPPEDEEPEHEEPGSGLGSFGNIFRR